MVQEIIALKWAFLASFDAIGNISGTYTIRTDPSITPVQYGQSKVPIEYREQIECTLSDMVEKGVIAPVSQTTEWVSSLTYPCKPDGTLHICLNPKDLNKAILWEHYKACSLNEISHHLSGATYFSKLDAKDGSWSIHLDEKSSYLTTCNMHHGRYRFLYMPFGLKMSQDVFQMQMDQATDHLPSTIAIYDDISIYSCTPSSMTNTSCSWCRQPMSMALSSTRTKCQIRQPQISFYDTVFTAQGMWPDPTKIQALQDLLTPNSQVKLQSFLGLINYLQPFISSLSTKTNSCMNS